MQQNRQLWHQESIYETKVDNKLLESWQRIINLSIILNIKSTKIK